MTALALMMVFVLALLAQGYWGWRDAHRHYLGARHAAEFLLNHVVDDLANTPGQAEMRRAVLQQVLTHAEPFLLEEGGDLPLELIHARTLSGLGDLEREQGRMEASRDFRRRALDIHQRLAAQHPDRSDLQAAYSISLVKFGDLAKECHDPETALHWYRRALQIDERLAGLHADDLTIQDNLAWSYERLADLARSRGELEAAARFNQLRLGQVRQLQHVAPDDERVLHHLVCAHSIIADTAAVEGREDIEIEHRALALESAGRLGGRFPSHRVYQARLAGACASMSVLELRRGDITAADALITDAFRIMDAFANPEANDMDARSLFVGILLHQATVRERQGLISEAGEALTSAIEHADAIHHLKPHDAGIAAMRDAARARRVNLGLSQADDGTK